MRTKSFGFILTFIFLLLILGMLNLNVFEGYKYQELSKKNYVRLLPQIGARGRILDRQGDIIVDNKLCYDVMILPQETSKVDEVLMSVSRILETDFRKLKDTFRKDYIAPFAPVTIAKNIDVAKAAALEELKFELSGVVIQPRPVRRYPYGRLACHAIGYLNEIDRWRLTKLEDYGYKTKDIVGFGGVEEKYDYYLRQEEGGLSVEVDHRGKFRSVLALRPPQSGKDIQLTLDLKVQKAVEQNLVDRGGSVVIMDPYTGEIIAMASFPNFNPAIFVDKSDSSINNLFDNPEAPFVNRAITGVYPAGSVFKLIVATAGLETGKINKSRSFVCSGSTKIGNMEFSCWDTHGQQNLFAAITHSCNIFFYRTGFLVGAQVIHDYALKLGLSRPTGINLPYEAAGFVPSPLWKRIYRFKNWFDGDTANLSIGQGDLLVTPLQITRMMAVFANQGLLVNPYIIKTIDGTDVSLAQQKSINLHINPSTMGYIRQALRNVVQDPAGTGHILAMLEVQVSGKTGTVQVPHGQPHAWFVGFFPYKKARFVICVFLEHGGSGQAACLLARQIIEEMLKEKLVELQG